MLFNSLGTLSITFLEWKICQSGSHQLTYQLLHRPKIQGLTLFACFGFHLTVTICES